MGRLLAGIIRHLREKEAYDQEFVRHYTVGFDEIAAYAEMFTPSYVSAQTGLTEEEISRCCSMVTDHLPRTISYVGVSLEHQDNGVDPIRTIACLGAISGSIDIKGGDLWRESLGWRE